MPSKTPFRLSIVTILLTLAAFIAPAAQLSTISYQLPIAPELSSIDSLLTRLLGKAAGRFAVELIAPDPAGDVFEIESRGKLIVLRGNNGVSNASGLNWYLKYYCHCHYSLTGGAQLRLPNPLPAVSPKIRHVSCVRYRYFLNYCCFGYSLPWYDWPQWERLIDWMALNGVNLPLSVTGQEAIWQAVGHRLNWPEQELDPFLAGPPYLPFGWMGCLDGHGGPLAASWTKRHAELEQKILERQRSLGMIPVLQGFTGHVPALVTNRYPNAKLQRIKWAEWNTFLLDPLDPLFPQIAKVFMEEQNRLFGSDHYYAADTFIEMIPPSGDTNYLADVGRAIFDGMKASDPQAVWVLQGWPFFFARDFWTQPRIEAVLGPVPNSQILLLDLFCEKTPVWKLTRAFCGKPWVWCNIQNFGGRVWVGGALDLIQNDFRAALKDPAGGRLSGLGFVNEALGNNPVVFDLLFEQAWRSAPLPLDAWLNEFCHRAYGKSNPHAAEAWKILHETVFQAAFDNNSAFTLAPSLRPPPATPYDNDRLAAAWKELLAAADDLHDADPFRYDLIHITRQVLGNYSAEVHRDISSAFARKDRAALREASAKMRTLIRDLDSLLATRPEFLLGNWIENARRWGATPAERDRLEWNARRVLTLWGNGTALRDYSCREWSGMLDGFYLKRWEIFFRHLDHALDSGKPLDDIAFQADMFAFEQRWSDLHDSFPRKPRGDSVREARRLYNRYASAFAPDAVSLATGKPATCSSALPGHPASLANDGRAGNPDSYWATDLIKHPGDPWWQVDFKNPTRIGRVVLVGYYADQRHYGFTVELSDDGEHWDLVADRRDNREPATRQGYSCSFTPRLARYLRVTQTVNSANTGRHLVEVMAFEH